MLPEELAIDTERKIRFRKEARAASLVSHPNAAQIFELCETDGRNFIVMEYVEGINLRQYITEKKFSSNEVLDIIKQIAEALKAAHAAGVVHRDIKPENIIIKPDGTIKVLDFGLAKMIEPVDAQNVNYQTIVGAELTNPASTELGAMLGTPAYMSPEQVRGTEIDTRTDIWSLGVLLYELLTGELPFKGTTKMDVAAAILTTEPSLMKKESVRSMGEFAQIIKKCLSKEKQKRYQKADDLLADLRFLRQNLPQRFDDILQTVEERNHKTLGQTFSLIPSSFRFFPQHLKPDKWRAQQLLPLFVLIILGITTGSFLLQRYITGNLQEENIGAIHSLAVLPFQNINFATGTELYIEHGLSKSLSDKLITSPISVRSSSYFQRDVEVPSDIASLGRKLQVDLLIVGNVEQRNEQFIISVNLIRVSDGQNVWKKTFSDNIGNLPQMEDLITSKIAVALFPALEAQLKKSEGHNTPNNTQAYRLYLKGLYYWNRQERLDFPKAFEAFQQSLNLDPSYAPTYVSLAKCYAYGAGPQFLTHREAIAKAKALVHRALEIDGNLAEAHAFLGVMLQNEDNDWAGAKAELQKAVQLAPNSAVAHAEYAEYFTLMGEFDKALEEMAKATELDPISAYYSNQIARIYFLDRQYDKAAELFQKMHDVYNNTPTYHAGMCDVYMHKGEYEKALTHAQAYLEIAEDRADALAYIGRIYGLMGRKTEALQIIEKLDEIRNQKGELWAFFYVKVYVAIDDKEKAFYWLKKGMEDGLGMRLKVDPNLDGLRGDSRYNELMRQVGFL